VARAAILLTGFVYSLKRKMIILAYLVQGLVSSEYDVGVVDLHDSLTKPHQVSADSDGATRHQRHRHNLTT